MQVMFADAILRRCNDFDGLKAAQFTPPKSMTGEKVTGADVFRVREHYPTWQVTKRSCGALPFTVSSPYR